MAIHSLDGIPWDDGEEPLTIPPRTVPRVEAPSAERAPVDLLIERADLGPGVSTFIAAGDPIPVTLRGLPRHDRAPKAMKASKARPGR